MAAILNRGSYIFGLPGNLLAPSGGGRKIKMMKCDFFLKPGTHAGQNPNIINSSFPPPPNFKQQVIRGELWPSLGEIHETQASETIPVCREHICERRTL